MGDGNSGMDRLLHELTTIVSAASAAILTIRAGALCTRTKADQSPVTAADEAAEAIILEGLARVLPGVPVVSEESVERAPTAGLDRDFVLVDPLDGTRELVAGRDEFTVNVALVTAGRPHLGIVAAPALGLLWRGYPGRAERLRLAPEGAGNDPQPIRTRARPPPASSRPSAVRTSMPGPRHSSPGCRWRKPSTAARPSSSARSPRARPTSIRASARLANGTSQPARRC